MARRVPPPALIGLLALAAVLLPAAGWSEAADPESRPALLVGFSFEEEELATGTGPDTFTVIAHAKGSVGLASDFRVSGNTSLVIRDVPGDGDFPELVGNFPLRRDGHLYGHFALLLTTLDDELNIALAGPNRFQLTKDGIAFWLSVHDRSLVHWSDSMPKRLFEPELFTWYSIDLDLDLERGTYSLRILEEGNPEPRVALTGQPNAPAQPGSAVDLFSFIGDRGTDDSRVAYYVDDVVLGSDSAEQLPPFIAPGRRHLFVDSLTRFREHGGKRPSCLPAISLSDFVADPDAVARLREGLGDASSGRSAAPEDFDDLVAVLRTGGFTLEAQAHEAWERGCAAMVDGDTDRALRAFESALEAVPESALYQAAWALALAQAGRFDEADEYVFALGPGWREDPRFPVLASRLGAARGDLGAAEAWLVRAGETMQEVAASPLLSQVWTGQGSLELTRALAQQFPEAWHLHLAQALIPEQYFYTLLWQERFEHARDYALALADLLERVKLPGAAWRERAGDAAFHDGDDQRARELYERCFEQAAPEGNDAGRLMLKLADVHYRQGNLAEERRLREAIYGSLRTESQVEAERP